MTTKPRGHDGAGLLAVSLQAIARALTVQAQVLEAHADLLVDQVAARQLEPAPPMPEGSPLVTDWSGIDGCPHPEDERLPASTLRARQRFFCKACGRFIDPTAAPSTLAPTTT